MPTLRETLVRNMLQGMKVDEQINEASKSGKTSVRIIFGARSNALYEAISKHYIKEGLKVEPQGIDGCGCDYYVNRCSCERGSIILKWV